jgi:hypothetical protein
LKPEAGGTHVGLFLAWALLSGLAGALRLQEMPDELGELRRREITPGAFFLRHCDGKLTDDDLSEEGNWATSKIFRNWGRCASDEDAWQAPSIVRG